MKTKEIERVLLEREDTKVLVSQIISWRLRVATRLKNLWDLLEGGHKVDNHPCYTRKFFLDGEEKEFSFLDKKTPQR